MEFLLDLMTTFWEWTVLCSLILIGFVINLFDKKEEVLVAFKYEEMPHMQPVPIETKGKGFWKAIFMWLFGVRKWIIAKDFHYSLGGQDFVIPKGFEFDGASVPKFLAMFLSPTGVLLMGGLIHDYGYKYGTLLKQD